MPEKEFVDGSIEKTIVSDRITANLDLFYSKIVKNLVGTLGKSQSGVINFIIKTWINDNLEDIKNVYGIDVAGIRREIISTKEDITKLNDIKNVIKEVARIKIDDLVELIEVNRANLLSLIINNNDKLNVVIDGDYISPKKD